MINFLGATAMESEVATSSEPESPASARGTTGNKVLGKGKSRGRSNHGKGRGRTKRLKPGLKTGHQSPSVDRSEDVCTSSEPPSSPEAARIRNAQAKFEARCKPMRKKLKTSVNSVEEFKQLCGSEESRSTALLDFLKIATSRLTSAELEILQKIDISYAEFHAGMGSGSIALASCLF